MRSLKRALWSVALVAVMIVHSGTAIAGCGDVSSEIELFESLFVADQGAVRKWNEPIKVFVTGEEEYVDLAKKMFDYYSTTFGIDIEYADENMDIYVAITNRLYATLLEHGEVLFKGTYENIGELFAFLKESAIKDHGYISKNRFQGFLPLATVIVVGSDYYNEEGVHKILNSLILNALFPGVREKTKENANSAFFKAKDLGDIDECTLSVMKRYYDERILAGMSWDKVRRIIAGQPI